MMHELSNILWFPPPNRLPTSTPCRHMRFKWGWNYDENPSLRTQMKWHINCSLMGSLEVRRYRVQSHIAHHIALHTLPE